MSTENSSFGQKKGFHFFIGMLLSSTFVYGADNPDGQSRTTTLTSGSDTSYTNEGIISIDSATTPPAGMESSVVNATFSNNGSGQILTAGTAGIGINALGSGATINNTANASILTNGASAPGISVWEVTTHTVNNAGSIMTAGADAPAILLKENTTGIKVINSGVLSTRDSSSSGIQVDSINADITNAQGSHIVTIGESSPGILSNVGDSVVNNSGLIETFDNFSAGVSLGSAENGAVVNAGNIHTKANSSHGIISLSSNPKIGNTGSIIVEGVNASGILTLNSNATIENSGDIESKNHIGIYTRGENASVLNSGNILAGPSSSSFGIFSEGEGSEIINSGYIYIEGSYVSAMAAANNESSAINYGRIESDGDSTIAIRGGGLDVRIVNSGTIVSNGPNSIAMYTSETNESIYNAGVVNMLGANSRGLYSEALNGSVVNTGSVYVSDSAIIHYGSGAVIENQGELISTSSTSPTIYLLRENSKLNNSGAVRSTGDANTAILLENNDSTVCLNKGSVVQGKIVTNGSNSSLIFNMGSGLSYAYETEGDWTLKDLDGRAVVVGSAVSAGVSAQETAPHMLYQRMFWIGQSFDRRLKYYEKEKTPIDVGILTGTHRSHFPEASMDLPLWVEIADASAHRPGENYSTRASFDDYRYGVSTGFQLPVEDFPVEALIHVEKDVLSIEDGNQKIHTTSVDAGLLFPHVGSFAGVVASSRVMIGANTHAGLRKVWTNNQSYANGYQFVDSTYHSIDALAGLALRKKHAIAPRWSLDGLIALDIAAQHFGAYHENAYYAWAARTLIQSQPRVEIGLTSDFQPDALQFMGRIGYGRRDILAGHRQHYHINGQRVDFSNGGRSDNYVNIHGGIAYPLLRDTELFASVDMFYSSDKVFSAQEQMGLRVRF